MPHDRKARLAARRSGSMASARSILEQINEGSRDPSEAYRLLYGLYASSNGLLKELEPFFRLPFVGSDGSLGADEEFRGTVRLAAARWLLENPG